MGSPLWQKKNKTKQRCDYLRCIFLKARNDSFLSKRSLNIISRWLLPQNRKCKKCHFFYQNHGLTPLEDMEKCDYQKCIFLKARNDSLLYWTTFARHGDSFWKLSKSSLHLVLGLPRFLVCPRRVLNVMLIVQRLSVLLAKKPAQFHLSLHIISMISGTLVSSRIQWDVLRSRHDSLMRSLHSSEFQDLLFLKILGHLSVGDC